jgi:hypothetical protein
LPAVFSPARHWTAGGLLEEAESGRSSDRRRGCRRDIRSTAGSDFEQRSRFSRDGPAEETVFLRTVRITFKSAVSSQAYVADVKSGPDVFADALVPKAGEGSSRRLISKNIIVSTPPARGGRVFAPWLSLCQGRKVNDR